MADKSAIVVLCSSQCTMGLAEGLIDAKTNLDRGGRASARSMRCHNECGDKAHRTPTLCHVKDHSTDTRNNRAHELVWCGKETRGPVYR